MTGKTLSILEIVLLVLSFLAVYYMARYTPYLSSAAIIGGVSAAVLMVIDALRRDARGRDHLPH
jgi:hypothetical protein